MVYSCNSFSGPPNSSTRRLSCKPKVTPVALRALCIIFAVVLQVTSTRAADHEILLHDFDVSFPDGTNPTAGLILDAAGNLYGTTYGIGGSAIVFELSPGNGGGWTETILHNFADFRGDGYAPYSGLMMDGTGNLYGNDELWRSPPQY